MTEIQNSKQKNWSLKCLVIGIYLKFGAWNLLFPLGRIRVYHFDSFLSLAGSKKRYRPQEKKDLRREQRGHASAADWSFSNSHSFRLRICLLSIIIRPAISLRSFTATIRLRCWQTRLAGCSGQVQKFLLSRIEIKK